MDYTWKIWYETGCVVGTTREEFENAPSTGVVMIYESFGKKSNGLKLGTISCGSDWYWMNGTDNHISQYNGYHPEENKWLDLNVPENAIMKQGKLVSDIRMQEVVDEMVNH